VEKSYVGLFVLAHLLDIVTTNLGLRLGVVEGNPLMARLFNLYGEAGGYALKLLIVCFIVATLNWTCARHYKANHIVLAVFTLITFAVVVSNVNEVYSGYLRSQMS
jgi:hypothetical protein